MFAYSYASLTEIELIYGFEKNLIACSGGKLARAPALHAEQDVR